MRPPLKSPYDGPYEVFSRTNKTFELKVKNRTVPVSIDRIKVVYLPIEDEEEPDLINHQPKATKNSTVKKSVERGNEQPKENNGDAPITTKNSNR